MKLRLENLGDCLDELILARGEEEVMMQLSKWMAATRFETPATRDDVQDIIDGITYAFTPKGEEDEDDE